jgi:hypothetical protein
LPPITTFLNRLLALTIEMQTTCGAATAASILVRAVGRVRPRPNGHLLENELLRYHEKRDVQRFVCGALEARNPGYDGGNVNKRGSAVPGVSPFSRYGGDRRDFLYEQRLSREPLNDQQVSFSEAVEVHSRHVV